MSPAFTNEPIPNAALPAYQTVIIVDREADLDLATDVPDARRRRRRGLPLGYEANSPNSAIDRGRSSCSRAR